MTTMSSTFAADAKFGSVRTEGDDLPIGRLTAAVMRVAHGMFGRKIPHNVAALAGRSLSTAERWQRGTRVMDAEDLLTVLSDPEVGAEFLRLALWPELPEQVQQQFLRQIELDKKIARAEREQRRRADQLAQLRLELRQK